MTEVIQSSPSHFPSPSSSSNSTCVTNDIPSRHHQQQQHDINPTSREERGGGAAAEREIGREREGDQEVSIVELLVAVFRRSVVGCSINTVAAVAGKEVCKMEIGVPTNVRHVAHVTFDRFNGFLGLPVEFEPEVPRRAPSASTTVFGVSTESMQLSFDSRGNSVPTILLMMQRCLYTQGGLQAEGIFRINAENSQEEYVRDQLNNGVIPEGIDVHCLAGLIKAWFRELPTGVLDSLSPEQVMESQSEEECARLVSLLPPTEAALLDWAINLMADVAQLEHLNKMNARNIAMVFAPNMTHMSDPLTALMYAVQVMNFLKTLIIRTLREREEAVVESTSLPRIEPSDQNGHQTASRPSLGEADDEASEGNEEEKVFVTEDPALESHPQPSLKDSLTEQSGAQNFLASIENIPISKQSLVNNCPCDVVSQLDSLTTNENQEGDSTRNAGGAETKTSKSKTVQTSNMNPKKGAKNPKERTIVRAASPVQKGKGTSIVGRTNTRAELFEAWR